MRDSPFLQEANWHMEGELAVSLRDNYPVTRGHTLIVPRRLVASVFDMTEAEILDCWRLLQSERAHMLHDALPPDGFNIGVNDGEVAGQTIAHAHIHLIPRRRGDHPNPRGGIRAVIPGKASYLP